MKLACPAARSLPLFRECLAARSSVLLGVVAEKTGYPVDMLNLGMSLDGDLGVDSIKRVEILSALQDKLPNAPVVKPEQLGTLHTLQDVADFLGRADANSELTPKTEPVSAIRMPVASFPSVCPFLYRK